jgi:hypothetical protein
MESRFASKGSMFHTPKGPHFGPQRESCFASKNDLEFTMIKEHEFALN